MPLIETKGAASAQGFGLTIGGAGTVPVYIEEIFSTYLYTGNGSTQTITNGIDLSGKGGLVWLKSRSAVYDHKLHDTARGITNWLASNTTGAQSDSTTGGVTAANANGFSLGSFNGWNASGTTFASWTFRKQPKFFDVVTYTGNGTDRTIAHNLGSTPGCIIVKRTDTTGDWRVYHRSTGATNYLVLNATDASTAGSATWNDTAPTSTVFSLGTTSAVNANGGTYVAYVFAHNAGGFGLTGTDNVISCGSYTGTGSAGNNVTLGYEPQFLMIKRTDNTGNWIMVDTMRGFVAPSAAETNWLRANTAAAEDVGYNYQSPTSTGFVLNTGDNTVNASGASYIYIAIRRGPMKVPTDATKVFKPVARSGTGSTATITAGFPVDLEISKTKTNPGPYGWFDRLRGATLWLTSSSTASESTASDSLTSFASNTGVIAGADLTGLINYGSDTYANWMFQRAPSFFDEVCYTGTGSARTVTHNLSVVPEMMIVKARVPASGTFDWFVYTAAQGNGYFTRLNSSDAKTTGTQWNSTTPTSSVFSIGATSDVNQSGGTYVAYLFATCAGVSKVGSYTGTGTTQTINCGFTGGARFVLIKRTNSPGDWYVWDSARGITSGNDPYLLLNSDVAEVTGTNYVDTDSTGFQIVTSNAGVNASGGTYIFLAIA